MELGQIEAFLAVIGEGNFTRAARRLNISQPSLSARIRQLEKALEGALFYRDRRPVEPTPLGLLFVDYARRAVDILVAGQDAVASARLGEAGRVRLAAPFSLATSLLPEVVLAFRDDYPLADLQIETGHSDFAIGRLLEGIVDLALAAAFPRLVDQVQVLHRLSDVMVGAVHKRHALATGAPVSPAVVQTYPWLLVHWGAAFGSFVATLRSAGETANETIELPLAVVLPLMRRSTDFVTFLPRRLTAAAGLVELEIASFHFSWDTILATRFGRDLTPLEASFAATVAASWQSHRPRRSI